MRPALFVLGTASGVCGHLLEFVLQNVGTNGKLHCAQAQSIHPMVSGVGKLYSRALAWPDNDTTVTLHQENP